MNRWQQEPDGPMTNQEANTNHDAGMNAEMSSPSGGFSTAPPLPDPEEHGLTRGTWFGLAVITLIVLVVVVWGMLTRSAAE